MSAAERTSATTVGTRALSADDPVLHLPSQCTIRDAAQLLGQLMLRVEHSAPVYIDAAKVERIDTAALQLLVAFLNDRKSQQRAVVWLDCSEAMMRAARALGLAVALSLAPA
jgi:phospholipid transport system transporter-binding protein